MAAEVEKEYSMKVKRT